MNQCQPQCIPHTTDAYAGRMHAAYAEENRTEQSTNEDCFVTFKSESLVRDVREKATKNA